MENPPREAISDSSIELILRSVLKKRFPSDGERQRLVKRTDRYNFCCPYCGDSTVAHKKRGNFYPTTLHYVCYNGGCDKHADLLKLAKDFKCGELLSPEEQTAMKLSIMNSKENMAAERVRRSELSLEALVNVNFASILPKRQDIMKRLSLSEVHPRSFMGIYLSKRFQNIDERFAWDQFKKRLYIFNMDKSGEHVFALQTRQLDSAGSKYLTYNLSGMLTKLMGIEDEALIEKARDMDHVSTVFGILKINFNSTVTLFEGPLDSFLFPNSVGMCSIKNDWPFDTENYRLFQDNDEAGRKKALELIDKGHPVFLWRKYLEEKGLQDKRIKDYNDLVIHAKINNIQLVDIEQYFSTHRYDGIYL